jgi:hypothetical protein
MATSRRGGGGMSGRTLSLFVGPILVGGAEMAGFRRAHPAIAHSRITTTATLRIRHRFVEGHPAGKFFVLCQAQPGKLSTGAASRWSPTCRTFQFQRSLARLHIRGGMKTILFIVLVSAFCTHVYGQDTSPVANAVASNDTSKVEGANPGGAPAQPPDPQTHPQAITYSDAYQLRARIHRYASFATLPLFATQLALGQSNTGSSPTETPPVGHPPLFICKI